MRRVNIFDLAAIDRLRAELKFEPRRVRALRTAFWNAADSDALRADAERMNLMIEPMNGADTEAALRAAIQVPSDIVDRAKVAIN